MFEIKFVGEHFLGIRSVPPILLSEVADLRQSIAKALVHKTEVITCVDWRSCGVAPPHVLDELASILKHENKRVKRCAVLVSSDANSKVLVNQLTRVLESANNSGRKLFKDKHEASSWLHGHLNPQELAGLHDLLRDR